MTGTQLYKITGTLGKVLKNDVKDMRSVTLNVNGLRPQAATGAPYRKMIKQLGELGRSGLPCNIHVENLMEAPVKVIDYGDNKYSSLIWDYYLRAQETVKPVIYSSTAFVEYLMAHTNLLVDESALNNIAFLEVILSYVNRDKLKKVIDENKASGINDFQVPMKSDAELSETIWKLASQDSPEICIWPVKIASKPGEDKPCIIVSTDFYSELIDYFARSGSFMAAQRLIMQANRIFPCNLMFSKKN